MEEGRGRHGGGTLGANRVTRAAWSIMLQRVAVAPVAGARHPTTIQDTIGPGFGNLGLGGAAVVTMYRSL